MQRTNDADDVEMEAGAQRCVAGCMFMFVGRAMWKGAEGSAPPATPAVAWAEEVDADSGTNFYVNKASTVGGSCGA